MKTVMSFKVDKDVRDKARRVAKKIGVPLSMVVNNQLKRFVEEGRIEFREPLVPNAKTRKILDQALKDIREGNEKAFSPMFTNAEDAVAWLGRNDS